MDHDRSRSIIIQVGWNSRFMIFSYDLGIVPGWIRHHSGMIMASFSHDSDMIFRWFSNDFDDVLEWSQKHFCLSSGAVLDLFQNQCYRARVNKNPGFRPRLRSWYRSHHPRPTSIFMAPRKVPVLSRWIPSFKGHHVSPFKSMGHYNTA